MCSYTFPVIIKTKNKTKKAKNKKKKQENIKARNPKQTNKN